MKELLNDFYKSSDITSMYNTGRELAINLNDEIFKTMIDMKNDNYDLSVGGGIVHYTKEDLINLLVHFPSSIMAGLSYLEDVGPTLDQEELSKVKEKFYDMTQMAIMLIDAIKSPNQRPLTEATDENIDKYISDLKTVMKSIRKYYEDNNLGDILEPRKKTIDKMEDYLRGAIQRKYTLRIPMYKVENASEETRERVEEIIKDFQGIVAKTDEFAILSPDWSENEDIYIYLTLKEPYGEKGDKKDRVEDSKEDKILKGINPEFDTNSNKKDSDDVDTVTESMTIESFLENCTGIIPIICPTCGGKLGFADGKPSKFKCNHCGRVFGDPENSHVKTMNESALNEGIVEWFRNKKERFLKWREQVKEEKKRRREEMERERIRLAKMYSNIEYPSDYRKVASNAAKMFNAYVKTSSYGIHLFDERAIISDIMVNPPHYRFICAVLINVPNTKDNTLAGTYFMNSDFYNDVIDPFMRFYRKNEWFDFDCETDYSMGSRMSEPTYTITVYAKLRFDYVEMWQKKPHAMMESSSLSKEERDALPDDQFGLPSLRKYPLNDERHVREAIKMFHFAKNENKQELANNIARRVKELGLEGKVFVSKKHPFKKYFPEWLIEK